MGGALGLGVGVGGLGGGPICEPTVREPTCLPTSVTQPDGSHQDCKCLGKDPKIFVANHWLDDLILNHWLCGSLLLTLCLRTVGHGGVDSVI